MLKYGLLGGGALVAVIVVIVLIKVLFGGVPAKSGATGQSSAPTAQVEAAQTLTLTATDATRVKIVQDLNEAVVFNGSLARGETKSFKKQGALRITVEDSTKVRIEVNGQLQKIPAFEGGGTYGRFLLD